MQLFVKIFQAVGMAMQTMHQKGRTATKTNTLILRLNYSLGAKQKNSYSYRKNDALHSENNVYAYFRYNNNETVMVLINNNNIKQ
jgi:hypothetical protein